MSYSQGVAVAAVDSEFDTDRLGNGDGWGSVKLQSASNHSPITRYASYGSFSGIMHL